MQHPGAWWDVFCRVIDNFGDVGVCWRLAAELAARGQRVRLRVDDARALCWMAPHGMPGVEVLPFDAPWVGGENAPCAVVEAFGCEAPAPYLSALATHVSAGLSCVLVNLEYLSAEPYVQRCHRLPSPIGHGAGAGLVRWFFYPGFIQGTGGLLREWDLGARQAAFDREDFRHVHGVRPQQCAISLFCYEPHALGALLQSAQSHSQHLWVTPGRASAAVRQALQNSSQSTQSWVQERVRHLEHCSQKDFDHLLWASDLNCVRGEDSLVRALWAAQPLLWHIYPQDDGAHVAKLQAFLDWLQAPESLRRWHWAWCGMSEGCHDGLPLPALDADTLAEWGACTVAARQRLLQQTDLLSQLQVFVAEKS